MRRAFARIQGRDRWIEVRLSPPSTRATRVFRATVLGLAENQAPPKTIQPPLPSRAVQPPVSRANSRSIFSSSASSPAKGSGGLGGAGFVSEAVIGAGGEYNRSTSLSQGRIRPMMPRVLIRAFLLLAVMLGPVLAGSLRPGLEFHLSFLAVHGRREATLQADFDGDGKVDILNLSTRADANPP